MRKKKIFTLPEDGVISEDFRKILTKSARGTIIFYLSKSDKTRKQLYDKLKEKNIPEDIINEQLDYYTSIGYIDDYKYAHNFIESQRSYSKNGDRIITQKLYYKGIDREIIQQALEDLGEADHDSQYEKIFAIAEQKLRQIKPDDPQRYMKLSNFIYQKGYSGSIVREVIEELLQNE